MVALNPALTCEYLPVNHRNQKIKPSRSGPLISPAAKERVTGLIASAEEQGGTIHLDGRGIQVPDYLEGNFIGPTIIEAGTEMRCYVYVACILARAFF